VVVSGTAGVGKNTLAVRWANGVAAAFPDGQLYVNLRGFDPAGQAVPPTEVLHGFLQALGVPAKEIPAALDERAALYRTVLAGRRTLIVLDNAGDEDHVRPLLPGAPGALVLVTSRDRLTGLVVAEGARPIPLDLPSVAEARQILAQRLGAERVAAEPDAVDAIIARCARLPLALAVAAAHPAADPAFTLGGLADQLGRGGSALDSFPGGDPATDVRLVFARSYRALSEPAARLFRLLGVCPTAPHLTLAGAASLAGRSTTETRRLLAELTRMHLLTGLARDRYGCHDLLRAFATELTSGLDRAADRSAALHRLLEHYLHTAFAAGLQLRPGNPPVILPAAPSGVSAGRPADIGAATTWFTDELSALLAAVRLTPPAPDWRPWQLACGLIPFLDQQGRWDDYAASFHAGFAAAERAGDTLGQAHAQFYLGRVHVKMNRLAEAREHLERAIHLFGVIGDASGQAGAYLDAAHVAELEGRDRDSMRQCERALVLNRAAGDRAGEAYTLSNLGYLHLKLGDLDRALELNEQGLAMHRDNGDHRGQADTLNHLGRVHFRRGDSRRGADSYGGAIAIYQRFGFRRYEADSLTLLGDDLAAAGDLDAARGAWQRAKTLLDDLGRPDAGPTVLAAR
jgi:tetratricopeptide (TPR) repeat protein